MLFGLSAAAYRALYGSRSHCRKPYESLSSFTDVDLYAGLEWPHSHIIFRATHSPHSSCPPTLSRSRLLPLLLHLPNRKHRSSSSWRSIVRKKQRRTRRAKRKEPGASSSAPSNGRAVITRTSWSTSATIPSSQPAKTPR